MELEFVKNNQGKDQLIIEILFITKRENWKI